MKHPLTWLVRLFPGPFRQRFGAEMREQIEHEHTRALERGVAPMLWRTLTTAVDLVRSAIAERTHPTWVAPWTPLETRRMPGNGWLRDLRHATRFLLRTPGFLVMTVGTLALAIGVNAGMFSIVDAVLLNPLPFASADRLVYIAGTAPGSDLPEEFAVAPEFYVQYKEQSRLLEDISTFNTFTSTMRVGDRVERIRMSWPTNSLFTTLGATPILGRLPVDSDGDRAVVISHALWTSWFGSDSSVLGRSYPISGDSRTIIGVMGPEFRFPDDGTLLWISSVLRPEGLAPGRFGTGLVARMAPGATPDAVAAELTALARRLPERFGGPASYARLIEQHRAVVRTLRDQLLGELTVPLLVLFGAVVIVLIVACANVANLFMVRAEGRQRDLAVRRAIGAARGQLIRLQLSEAFVVAVLAGVFALFLAYVSLPAFVRSAPQGIPRLGDVALSRATLLYTLVAAVLSALACGAVPAIRASAPDLSRLRDGGRGSTRRGHWARDGLVIGQTALALVLLIGSGLLARSFRELKRVDPGYDTENVFTFQIAPEGPALRDGLAVAQFDLGFMERLRALPGVESVGLVENVPLNEGTGNTRFRADHMGADAGPLLHFTYAAGDYFETMGIDLIAGRPLEARDQLTTVGNVVVSRGAAEALWPGENPLGKRLQRDGTDSWETVVGVVGDVLQNDFREAPEATVYYGLLGPTLTSWIISSPAYVVKTPRAEEIAPEIRAIVHEIAPEAPMYRTFTMAGLAKDSMVGLAFMMMTLGVAATLALVLGAVGLYGVLSYVVAQRSREIGVRMALGAKAEQVRRMVVAQGARVVGIGVAIGLVIAFASTRALGSMLFGVAAVDAVTFVAMSGSLLLVGFLATYLPARRASNIDPIESLRGE